MGNYKNFESDFIQRTLELISQYENFVHSQEFKNQYNYTLLLNCLLGLIVMPKERTIRYLPKDKLTKELRMEMGLIESTFSKNIISIFDLIISLRHSIAHFDFEIKSYDENLLFDAIEFKDTINDKGSFAIIKASEFLPFLRYYSSWLIKNLEMHKNG